MREIRATTPKHTKLPCLSLLTSALSWTEAASAMQTRFFFKKRDRFLNHHDAQNTECTKYDAQSQENEAKTHQVVKSRGQHCGDIEMVGYLPKTGGPVSLVLDLRVAHDRVDSSPDPTLNGHLRYPNNLDQSLNDTTTAKLRKYRADYNFNPPRGVGFMTAITSTSGPTRCPPKPRPPPPPPVSPISFSGPVLSSWFSFSTRSSSIRTGSVVPPTRP
jgi:hypothetical protein